jgi:hypothetical protein
MALDITWIVTVSLIGIVVTATIFAIVNILSRRSGKDESTRTNGLVQ